GAWRGQRRVSAGRAHRAAGYGRYALDGRGAGHREPRRAANQRLHYGLSLENFPGRAGDRGRLAHLRDLAGGVVRRRRRDGALAVAVSERSLGFQFDLQLFAQERTEPATPKRREEARRKGQVARTAELGTALVLLAGFGVLSFWAARAGATLVNMTTHYLGDGVRLDPSATAEIGRASCRERVERAVVRGCGTRKGAECGRHGAQ